MTSRQGSAAPLVSVIIPTYNCAHCLPEALESLFSQTCTNFEVIVVDDGSTDNTEAAIAPWRNRIVYIRREHAGESAARNAAIKASSAPYIAFLDADDLWLPAKVERQLSMIETDPSLGMVCADFAVHFDDGRIVESFFSTAKPIANGDLFERMVSDCFTAPTAVMLRRTALRHAGEFDAELTICPDLHMWLRVAYQWKVAALHEVLCVKRERVGARSYDLTMTSWIAALHKVLTFFPGMISSKRSAVTRQIGELHYRLGKDLLVRKQSHDSRKHLQQALRIYPLHAALLLILSFFPASTIRGVSRWKRRLAFAR